MKTLFLPLVFTFGAVAQTWTPVTPTGDALLANGFYNKLLFDNVNNEMLYYGHPTSVSTIYSTGIWGYNAAAQSWTLRANDGMTVQGCAQNGAPYNAYNPLPGHPQGYFWYDTTHHQAQMTGQLCQSQFMGYTGFYNSGTHLMGTPLAKGLFGVGDGTFNANLTNFQNVDWISGYGKAVFCCYSGGGTTPKIVEFNGVDTYTDITAAMNGDALPMPLTAMATMPDNNNNLWILGGCNGTSPGNFAPNACNGPQLNDLYRYNANTKTVTKMNPVGGIKPPTTNASFPFAYFDTRRNQIVDYAETNHVWIYNVAANTWTDNPTTGGFVIPSAGSIGPDGNMAQYDPVNDIGVFMYPVGGGGAAPLVYHLTFSSVRSTSLTVQEATFPGGFAGATRTNEPFCQGIAIQDNWGLTSISALTIANASAGQFRIIGSRLNGNGSWLKVCGIVPNLAAGGTASLAVTTGGSGNFGGSNLATDNGSTITVATGATTFVIRKANFNGFDTVDSGGTHFVSTNTSDGFYLKGPDPTAPYPSNVTCLPTAGGSACTTDYKSSNDAFSSVTIEENGPVMASLVVTWTFKDAGGAHSYGTVNKARMFFFKGKAYAKIQPILKNDAYGTSNTAQTAYKGLAAYEFRFKLATGGTQTITFGNHTSTPTTATATGTDDLYIYQGVSTNRQFEDNSLIRPYNSDPGYVIRKNGGTAGLTGLTSGSSAQSPDGWADVADASGIGVQIGMYWFGPTGWKSLEFAGGGTDVRLGILPGQASAPYYIEWPAWVHETDLWINFHAAALAAPSIEFNKWQSFLIARQPIADYNAANVFPHPLLDPTAQDTAETAAFNSANPATISSGNAWSQGNVTKGSPTNCPGSNGCPNIVRAFSWNLESDYRWDYLMTWLQRGWASRYLQSLHFSNFQSEYAAPHSTGYHWYDHWDSSFTEVDGFGQPKATSQNGTLGIHGAGGIFSGHGWHDQEHGHWWGQTDLYFLSGDEFQKEAMVDEHKNWFLAPNTYQNGGYPASNTITTVANSPNITLSCCTVFNTTVIGQYLLAGSGLSKSAYKVVSLTDSTHVVVSPAPAASATNVPVVWGNGLYNTRAAATSLISGTRYWRFLQQIGDSDYTGVQQQITNLYNTQVKSEACMSGYPAGCSFGTVGDATSWKGQGISRKRGAHWGGAGGSGNWCGYGHNYRVNSAFQSALMTEALLDMRWAFGPSWAEYWNAGDLAYGVSKFALSELFVDAGNNRWDQNGWRFGLAFDVQNNCQASTDLFSLNSTGGTAIANAGAKSFAGICVQGSTPCSGNSMNPSVSGPPASAPLFIINGTGYQLASVTDGNNMTAATSVPAGSNLPAYFQEVNFQYPSANLNVMQHFYSLWATDGKTDWATRLNQTMQMDMAISGTSLRDHMGHYETQALYSYLNPGTKTLQAVPINTFTDNGGGSYTINWTTPAGADYVRVKYAPSHSGIVDWIGFNPLTNSFTGNPANTAWFAAINATGIPAAVTGSQSMTVATGITGLTVTDFSVKVFAPSTCSISPSSAPTYTAGQSVSLQFAAALCPSSTWTATGLTGSGLTLNASTGLLSGTAAAGSYPVTISYSTASTLISIVVNGPPTITTATPLPTGTVGTAYTVNLAATGGTGALTWSVISGSLPPGLTMSSGGAITGTPTSAAGSPYSFTAAAVDANLISGSKSFTLPVNPGVPCTIAPTSLGPYTGGQTVSASFTASNCSTSSWSATGLTGSGLTLNSLSGLLSGTAVAGTYSAVISYSTASVSISILINATPTITTTSPLPTGTVGVAYLQALAATGGTGTLTWSVSSGTLPPGLSLLSGGTVTGTPTTATGSPFTFTAKVTDTNSMFGTKPFTISTNPSVPCTILPPSVGPFVDGNTILELFTAQNCPASTWSATGLAGSGLSMNASTGILSGVAVAGSYSVVVSYATATQPMTILILASGEGKTTIKAVQMQGVVFK